MTTPGYDAVQVVNVVNQHFLRSDAKDFAGARALWAEELTVDFGGLNPDAEGRVSAEDMERSARELVGPVTVTQHMISNHVVTIDGDDATVSFYEQALHHHPALGGDASVNTWTLYGRGEFRLHLTAAGWKITAQRLIAVHTVGNPNLLTDVAAMSD
nr:nuclear transport factor 2 family protein [Rhodococcus sp. (in: high G+C Gram-positive bacteria)]